MPNVPGHYERSLQGYRTFVPAPLPPTLVLPASLLRKIDFFVTGVLEQCANTIAFTQMIIRLRQELEQEIGHVQRRATLRAVLDALFEQPTLPVAAIAEQARISIKSAQAAIDILTDRGLVYEITGKQKGRVYAFRPVIDAIFGTRGA